MRFTIKHKIQLALLAVIVVISSVQAYLSISRLAEETESHISQRFDALAQSTSANIESWLAAKSQILTSNQSIIASTSDVERELLVSQHAGGFIYLYAGLESGDIVYGDKTMEWPEGYDPRTRPWYRLAINQTELALTKPYRDVTGEIVVTMAQSFSGAQRGVVAADLSLNYISEQISNLNIENQGFAFILDQDNRVLAAVNSQLVQQPATQLFTELQANQVNNLVVQDNIVTLTSANDNQPYLAHLSKLGDTGWTLGVVEKKSLVYQSINSQTQQLLITIAILGGLILAIATFSINRMFAPLHQLTDAVEKLSQGHGDLTQRFAADKNDEIGDLEKHMNTFLQSLQEMVSHITEDTHALITQIQHSAQLTQQTNQGISAQHQDVDQIATAIHEMSATANEVANHAEMTANAAQNSSEASAAGTNIINQSNESIQHLSQQLQQAATEVSTLENNAAEIHTILSTIQSIAEQTNLLALNAAIEAARAGEQGRGFAVVADEVRVLSHRTQDSTEEIRNMIATLQQNSQQAVASMHASTDLAQQSVDYSAQAQASLEEISQSIEEISDMATQIASAAEEQRAVSEDINRNTQAISDVSHELASQTQSVSESTQTMLATSEQVSQRLRLFKI
ncbi:methyl-accepting chemotaxis protein [Shewanella waksmanii]|uniref:methyl-accepting chemotaxis protein n=1 Tax=Shewanella waksmanii TaxID=213783 RepID=UPI0037353706